MIMRSLFLIGLLAFVGCSTIQIPSYISATHPYTRRIYADYDKTVQAVRDVLAQEYFKIQAEVDPAVYERDERYENGKGKNVLIFTDIKQMPRVIYSKYIHLNVYVRSLTDSVEVEVRYAKATSIVVKQFKGSRNDAYVNKILNAIEEQATSK